MGNIKSRRVVPLRKFKEVCQMTKRRIITLLLAIVMIVTLFTGCSSDRSKSEIITSEKTVTAVGSYAIFQTEEVQEYLNFLENFDETKYEIIDISTSMGRNSQYGGSMEFYMVTYKKIAE